MSTGVCQTISVLKELLRSAVADTEQAAMTINERVQAIDEAFTTLSSSVDRFGQIGERAADLDYQLGETVRSLIDAQRSAEGVELDQRTRMGEELAMLGQDCDVVTKVAEKTKILSINARIQATKGSDRAARGFVAVAEHVKELSLTSNQAAETISERVTRIRQEIADAEHAAKGERERLRSLHGKQDELRDQSEAMRRGLDEARQTLESESVRLGQLVADVYAAIQFQDIVRQKVEHVLEGLDKVSACVEGGDFDAAHLADGYAMESQRKAHESVTGQPLSGKMDAPVIELF